MTQLSNTNGRYFLFGGYNGGKMPLGDAFLLNIGTPLIHARATSCPCFHSLCASLRPHTHTHHQTHTDLVAAAIQGQGTRPKVPTHDDSSR